MIFHFSNKFLTKIKFKGLSNISFIPLYKHSLTKFFELKAVQPIIGISGIYFNYINSINFFVA